MIANEARYAELRAREYPQLEMGGITYLDFTGAALPSATQIAQHDLLLHGQLLGNPHSENAAARASSDIVERAREAVLAFFNADSREYAVCFTANASAAVKLVAESFPFDRMRRLVLGVDNHNSMNGVREYARRAGVAVERIEIDSELRFANADACFGARQGRGLAAFAAQSNFSGVRHPLSMVAEAKRSGLRVLLDAAALAPTSPLDIGALAPDFVAVSFYKMFGFPTGVGALIARHEALAELERPWFSGGTVEWVSTQLDRHRLSQAPAAFEDGTPNYYGLAAVLPGLAMLAQINMCELSARMTHLRKVARAEMARCTHAGLTPMFVTYGPHNDIDVGGVVAMNLMDDAGNVLPHGVVEGAARERGLAVRGGCFCNPGASEVAFGFAKRGVGECLSRLENTAFSPATLARCLGDGGPVGAIRMSFGLPTIERDITRGVGILADIARASRQREGGSQP